MNGMARYMVWLRDADWLNGERARAWCRVLAAVSLLIAVGYVATSHGGVDFWGRPLGTDFVSFWTAAVSIRTGHVGAVYDPAAHALAEQVLFAQARPDFYAFFYPPVFALLCLPLAYLPYLAALAAWLAGGFAPLFCCLRRILPQSWAVLPALVFPAWLMNAGHGQNGFLSASLFGLFMMCGRFPVLGGVCLGVLAFKPQLALAVPVALIAGRRWGALAAAAVTALALVGASFLVLGAAAWRGFIASAPLAREALEQGLVDPAKLVSVFSALRLLKVSVGFAYFVQALAGIGALAVLVAVARRRPGLYAEGAMLAVATCFCTPFLLDYDLAILALPLAFVMREACRTGWRPWEKAVLLAAYVLPLAGRPLAMATGVALAPLVIGGLLAVTARRACSGPEPDRMGAP